MYWKTMDSPIGILTLASNGNAITGLWMESHRFLPQFPKTDFCPSLPAFQQAEAWLHAYFTGSALPDMPPLSPSGTVFQTAVWKELLSIPYGMTTTYGSVSDSLQRKGVASSAQAVGRAVGRNPISILIPCHRVLGAGGRLIGYAGGLDVKKRLLQIEKIG